MAKVNEWDTIAARVRVSVFAAVTCFFMPEMFVVVIWTARRLARIAGAVPGVIKAVPGLLRTLGETAVKAYRKRRVASPGRRNVTIRCGGAGSSRRAAAWTRSRRCSTTSTI